MVGAQKKTPQSKKTNKDGSSPRRESENNATGFPAEAAGCPVGAKAPIPHYPN
jgi:hypothetical protein